MLLVIENQILAPISVYVEICKAREIIIERYDNYKKRTYRNRFLITNSTGTQIISIPLRKGKNSKKFVDVQIAYDDDWLITLRHTLMTAYGSSPYFHHFFESLMTIFEKKHQYLFDLNSELRDFIFRIFEIETVVNFSKAYLVNYDPGFYQDIREVYNPNQANISQTSMNRTYNQVFQDKIGFIPDLSIIDLVFNVGKFGIEILQH